jgi:hypothetical protein
MAAPNLSNLELEVLRKLVNGEVVSLSSQLRLRLELVGALREGAQGIAVTEVGKSLARRKTVEAPANSPAPESKVARDGRGRRMPNRRKSIF